MSVRVMAQVFSAKLPPKLKLVMLCMADYASDDGSSIFPKVETLAQRVGVSERTVQRALKELRGEYGLLTVVRRATPNFPTTYGINLQRLEGLQMESRGDNLAPPRGDNLSPKVNSNGSSKQSKLTKDSATLVVNVNSGTSVARTKHPLTDSQQIQAFRQVTGRNPRIELYDKVIHIVGDRTAEQLKPFWDEWLERGYNPQNIKWLTEWSLTGIPRYGNKTSEAAVDTFRRVLDGHENI